jgi:ATP-dependent protease HslVU (ClpYQ) ATPase subunit
VREIFISLDKMLTNRQGKLEKREMKVSEARPLLEDIESQRVISDETVRCSSGFEPHESLLSSTFIFLLVSTSGRGIPNCF